MGFSHLGRSDRFADRRHAGRVLAPLVAEQLAAREPAVRPGGQGPPVLVLGLPRGGVPVAAEVASALGAELDVLVVRKVGVPMQPELAMGAVAAIGGDVEVVRNAEVLARLPRRGDVFDEVAAREREELQRREQAYRAGRPPLDVTGKVVVLVDDGLATGSTMRAAAQAVARHGPARLVVAAPVGAPEVCRRLAAELGEVVCARMPERFGAVGSAYRNFNQTSDSEVRRALADADDRR